MKNGKKGAKKVEENSISGLEALLAQLSDLPKTITKSFELDVDNIQTLEDVKDVLRALEPQFECYTENMPIRFQVLLNKNIIKEVKKDESI